MSAPHFHLRYMVAYQQGTQIQLQILTYFSHARAHQRTIICFSIDFTAIKILMIQHHRHFHQWSL